MNMSKRGEGASLRRLVTGWAVVLLGGLSCCPREFTVVRIYPAPRNPDSAVVRASRESVEHCLLSGGVNWDALGMDLGPTALRRGRDEFSFGEYTRLVGRSRELCLAGEARGIDYFADFRVHLRDAPAGVEVRVATWESFTYRKKSFWESFSRGTLVEIPVSPTTIEPYVILRAIATCAGDQSLPPPRVPVHTAEAYCAEN